MLRRWISNIDNVEVRLVEEQRCGERNLSPVGRIILPLTRIRDTREKYLHFTLCTKHYALCTMHYALCTMHYVLCTLYNALCLTRIRDTREKYLRLPPTQHQPLTWSLPSMSFNESQIDQSII